MRHAKSTRLVARTRLDREALGDDREQLLIEGSMVCCAQDQAIARIVGSLIAYTPEVRGVERAVMSHTAQTDP